jgi:16S rRNA (uracil1498-N3)-methyltransferase
MQLFYEPEILENGGKLNEEESHHCVKVLRHKVGDPLQIINGKGLRADGILTLASPRECVVAIESVENQPPPAFKSHIAIAPTKSIDRFEWFLEKATELGIDEITPLLCQQSERKHIKPFRLEKVITSATKQSLRLWRPVLNPMITLSEFLNLPHAAPHQFIAHCTEDQKQLLSHEIKERPLGDVMVLIGPEGDFSTTEIELALKKGLIPVSLGINRLRTETAGIAACHIIQVVRDL